MLVNIEAARLMHFPRGDANLAMDRLPDTR